MFSRPNIPGNATLASLNSNLCSPTSPARSRLWSLDVMGSGNQSNFDDDFQSNMTFQASNGPSQSGFSRIAPAGLGIFYPSVGKLGSHGDMNDVQTGLNTNLDYRQRNAMRTGSIYEADIDTGVLEEASPDPFTLSSLLMANDFLRDDIDLMSTEPVIEPPQEPSPVALQEPPAPTSVNEQGRWVLQRILEASGHTIESLSAELKIHFGGLSHLKIEYLSYELGLPQGVVFLNAASDNQESDLQSNAVLSQTTFLRCSRDSPVLGINPAAIMPMHIQPQPYPDQICPAPPPETPELGLADAEDSEPEPTPCFLNATGPVNPEPLGSPTPLTIKVLEESEGAGLAYKRESDYEPSLSPSAESSNESAFMPSFSRRKIRPRSTKPVRRQSTKHILASPYFIPPEPLAGAPVLGDFPVDYGTPVLDAHRGIELSELKAKAARYRERNQGLEYDKKWLLSFAGKLTPQGLMTEEYRCYIIGCNQSNRRRDHILIHVGGHLDQRPFACSHCPARFLRKNECKRHELSHTGTRPFTCDICPLGATAFVRQDLLKRHQKRTHNMDNTRSRTTKRHRQI
ncbi:Transcription factor Sp1 [Leucoagaricus sp. SymC.cos]|nr:Transcription factor Sp1 [Leucoagaricus sp. SymC.cos]